MRKFILIVALLLSLGAVAEDPRERIYHYEILKPNHQNKPRVEGFAAQRVREPLGRGLTAQLAADGRGIYLSWRLLEQDSAAGFHLYRRTARGERRLTAEPVVRTTDFTDRHPLREEAVYRVEAVGSPAGEDPTACVTADYRKLRTAPRYTAIPTRGIVGKLGIGDLDGDGEFEFVVRTPDTGVDPGVLGRHFDSVYVVSAYRQNGERMWSYSLGEGVEPGVWYSPFVVYDFDGDGKSEVALRICPDGTRDSTHRVNNGHEYLAVLDGGTGREIARAPWPERSWRLGDRNRQSRHQLGVAYVDGRTPAIIAARGTYRAMLADAWQLHDGQLSNLWRWDGDEENPVVRSQGAHNLVAGDVDGDGRDEVLLGACMIDDNGTLLWSAGTGHPDKIYLTDIDPSRPGMEVLLCIEVSHDDGRGVCCVDAATGREVWRIGTPTRHVGDGMVADIDPAHPGLECFASEDPKGGSRARYLLTAGGRRIDAEEVPSCRNWVWWDGDLLRETLRQDEVVKWHSGETLDRIEGNILLIGDIDGDWREEIITAAGPELRIYRTCRPAEDRRVTLLQDPIYRSYLIERSQGYPQSPVPGYYLGTGPEAAGSAAE